MFWKCNWESQCCQPPITDLENISKEEFEDLISYCWCDDAPVPAEKLIEYFVESQRTELLSLISIEELIRMAYDPSIRGINKLTGTAYLQKDRDHCAPEQLAVLRKAAALKDQFKAADYQNTRVYESAIFEICRRNDAELLKIYLDEFKGVYPSTIYDAVFDYYIYMYLPKWNLLEQYNEQNDNLLGDYPGCRNKQTEIVSPDIQRDLLDILIQQADQCKVVHPEVLKILFLHGISSCRSVFPIREQFISTGAEFSNRDAFDNEYNVRILLHCDDKAIDPDNCIDPWDLNDLFTDSNYAAPITCTCGNETCGGITAVAESWAMGNKLRLYIPDRKDVYYFNVEDRLALQRELSLMLNLAVQNVQRYKMWRKKNGVPQKADEDDPISPYGTTVSDLKKLCRIISEAWENSQKNEK